MTVLLFGDSDFDGSGSDREPSDTAAIPWDSDVDLLRVRRRFPIAEKEPKETSRSGNHRKLVEIPNASMQKEKVRFQQQLLGECMADPTDSSDTDQRVKRSNDSPHTTSRPASSLRMYIRSAPFIVSCVERRATLLVNNGGRQAEICYHRRCASRIIVPSVPL